MLAITMIAINCVIPESLESFPILFKMNSKSHVYFTSVLPVFTLLGGDNNYVRPYLRAKAQISYAIVYKRRWQYILCKPPSYANYENSNLGHRINIQGVLGMG